MKWFTEVKTPKPLGFIIEEDSNVGFYIYVYENLELFRDDLRDPLANCISHQRDYLQDTLEQAKGFSFRKFGVPLDTWKQVE